MKANGAIIRSKAKWIEYGEKNSKYFLNLEKRNYRAKYIKKVIMSNGIEISEPSKVLEEQVSFYSDLYTSKCDKTSHPEIREIFLSNQNIPKLDPEAQNKCNEPLNLGDLNKALKEMALDKSPGPDGLTTNFYKCFWNQLKQPLLDSYLYSFKHGQLADGQTRGILNLIPKKDKDLRYLRSWRPVSLLATDYKILAKALAIRLQQVIPSLVHSDQVGYIKGRFIGENIITIKDLIQYSSINQKAGILALIDFEKAFDTVEWSFLFDTLDKLDLGKNFVKWVKLLYTNISSCISNNGYISKYFTLSRGIRQGCPISALLFILVAEILSINIRSDTSIRGINIKGTEFKIAQLADDTTVFLSDMWSLKQVISRFNKFGLISGLKVNLDKTEIVPLGGQHIQLSQLKGILQGIKIVKGPFKTLGIWFTQDENLCTHLNFNERLENIKKVLSIWKSRCLSWKGRITILKTLIVPKLIHLFSTIHIPHSILEKIDKLFLDFLWLGKPARVKKSTIIRDYAEGGLKMPDIYSIHASQKLIWIKRLVDNNDRKWKTLTRLLMGIDCTMLHFKLPEKKYKQCAKTMFYQQLVNCWYVLKSRRPIHSKEILNEFLLYNAHILIGGSCLSDAMVGHNKEHLKIQVKDIVDNTGKFLKLDDILAKLPLRLTHLEYIGLLQAIPKDWHEKLKVNSEGEQANTDLTLSIKSRLKSIYKITSRDIYWELIDSKSKNPTSLETWLDLFPFLETIDWAEIFKLANRITHEPALQTLQYKILNRTLNCRHNLCNWKITQSDLCNYCQDKSVDTLEHHLVFCPISVEFWNSLKWWINDHMDVTFQFSTCEILLGVPFRGNSDLLLLNCFILLGKWYINKRKTKEEPILFQDFLSQIKSKLLIYEDIYSKKEGNYIFQESYRKILDML